MRQPLIRHATTRPAAALLTALLLLSAACSGEEPDDGPATAPPATATTEPSTTGSTPAGDDESPGEPTGEATATASCENPEDGYALEYPAGWHVNDGGDPSEPCRVFHPEPFDLEPATEIPQGLAVVVDVESVAMERMLEGDAGAEELRREERTVAGREAVLIETRAGEDAPLQEPGTLTTRYLVRLGPERTFVARTTDRGDMAYEEKQGVLDQMVASVAFTG